MRVYLVLPFILLACSQAEPEPCPPQAHAVAHRQAGACVYSCEAGFVRGQAACLPATECEGPLLRKRDPKTAQLGPAAACAPADGGAVCVQAKASAPGRCVPKAALSFITRWSPQADVRFIVEDVDPARPPSGFDMSCDGGKSWREKLSAGSYRCEKMSASRPTLVLRGYIQALRFDCIRGAKLEAVTQWGQNPWRSMHELFNACVGMHLEDSAAPNLSDARDLSGLFNSVRDFNDDIGGWDTSQVENMEGMFRFAVAFNQDIGGWNTSKLKDASAMFEEAAAFNQDIGGWDTSSVTSMSAMFKQAAAFNQDISKWNTSKVWMMDNMFDSATSFNQNIGSWDTSALNRAGFMFRDATAFNGDIGKWNTSELTHARYMFDGAKSFNQDIGAWDTSKLQDIQSIFSDAASFNQDISRWDLSSVKYVDHRSEKLDPDKPAKAQTCKTGFDKLFMRFLFDGCPIEEKNKPPCLR